MLIHAGDLSWNGTEEEIVDFIEWFGALNYRHKIFIAGNHDDCLNGVSIEGMPHNCYYLCNSGIEIEGVKIWGIPFFLSDEIHWADLYPEKVARILPALRVRQQLYAQLRFQAPRIQGFSGNGRNHLPE